MGDARGGGGDGGGRARHRCGRRAGCRERVAERVDAAAVDHRARCRGRRRLRYGGSDLGRRQHRVRRRAAEAGGRGVRVREERRRLELSGRAHREGRRARRRVRRLGRDDEGRIDGADRHARDDRRGQAGRGRGLRVRAFGNDVEATRGTHRHTVGAGQLVRGARRGERHRELSRGGRAAALGERAAAHGRGLHLQATTTATIRSTNSSPSPCPRRTAPSVRRSW